MNILYIATKDPRLTNGGNEQRTNLLWTSLKKYGKVYTIVPEYDVEPKDELINSDNPIYKFKIDRKGRLTYGRIVNSIVKRLALINIWEYKTLKNPKLPNPWGIDFDIVVTRYVYTSCLWRFNEIAPTFIDIDDYPIQVYRTLIRKKLPTFLHTLSDYLVRYQTEKILETCTGGWIANADQLHFLDAKFCYLPNIPAVPSASYKKNEPLRSYLFTIGNMDYEPNHLGVDRFLSTIWPLFHSKYPQFKYIIAGKGAPTEYAERWKNTEGIEYMGYVEDIEDVYSHCIATVVPVYSGGGTCIKTLESLSYSRLCLSTRFGARGLDTDFCTSKGLLVFDDAKDFVSKFKTCLNLENRLLIEEKTNDVIEAKYSFRQFQEHVDAKLTSYKSRT